MTLRYDEITNEIPFGVVSRLDDILRNISEKKNWDRQRGTEPLEGGVDGGWMEGWKACRFLTAGGGLSLLQQFRIDFFARFWDLRAGWLDMVDAGWIIINAES